MEGEILLAGRDLREYDPDALRRSIAVVSQNTYLFSGTVRENLLLARPEASENEMVAAARQAQIHDIHPILAARVRYLDRGTRFAVERR